jgi:UDP-2-acetamido-2,6-beta-L-arabino-hexul-4-ose reductase
MIIGKGLIASAFEITKENYLDCVIFASGVSSSKENNDDEYNREKELIIETIKQNKGLKFIYFSSISVNVDKNKYFEHKLKIENIIKDYTSNYIIFRIPQLVGRNGNPNNLVNHIKNCVLSGDKIITNNYVERALLDVEDLVMIVNYCKDKTINETLNLSSIEKIKVCDLCNLIGELLNKTPIIKIVDNIEYNNWVIDNSELINEAIIGFNKSNYNLNILKKYLQDY